MPVNASPVFLEEVNGTLFFSGYDETHGRELWKYDLENNEIGMVKDINPSGDSDPYLLTSANGMLFFRADDGIHDREVWKSDGTESGSIIVKDLGAGSYPDNLISVNGTLFLTAHMGSHRPGLWKSDGTEAGMMIVKNINPFGYASIGSPTDVNGRLFFGAEDGVHGIEPWTVMAQRLARTW